MSSISIQVENLGKLYRIGKRERYRTLRDSLTDALAAPFRRVQHSENSNDNGTDTSIWALKGLSFEVKRGEVVGVIGRNGAGKSTLLKVLSRITEPTEGQVEIHGRVGSLLEVGTGFHPELTGRENIYLNGAILGMKRTEINRKFDEMVAFAEIEKFLDTPVKHYSSGMYVRLAFAVAAHLEPEILIVDEVLAVGDLQFQKKCLGKMGNVAKGGRTIVFVSHQTSQIRRLCSQCIWMDGGRLRSVGPTNTVVSEYEKWGSFEQQSSSGRPHQPSACRFTGWEIMQQHGANPHLLASSGPVRVKFTAQIPRPLHLCFFGIALFSSQRQLIWGNGVSHFDLSKGDHEFVYEFDFLPLQPGPYNWLVSLYDQTGLIDEWDCTPDLLIGTKPLNNARDDWSGLVNIPWKLAIDGTNSGTVPHPNGLSHTGTRSSTS